MARRQERSSEAAMLLEMLQVLQNEPRYEVAGRRIDEIGRRFVEAAEHDQQLELQRCAARMAFSVAIDKVAPFDTISERFHASCALGFQELLSELAVLIEFAYACGEFGEREAGLRVLGQAQQRLDRSGRKPGSAFVRQQSKFLELCRQRLEYGEAAEPHAPTDRPRD